MVFGGFGKLLLNKLTGVTNVTARRLPKGHDVEVVGESFRQGALEKAAQDDTGTLNAIIFREPDNEFDRNAVKVGVVVGGALCIRVLIVSRIHSDAHPFVSIAHQIGNQGVFKFMDEHGEVSSDEHLSDGGSRESREDEVCC